MLRSLNTLRAASAAKHNVASSSRLPALVASPFSTSSKALLATPAPDGPPKKKMVKLTIDGKEVEVEQGTALIQACEQAGAQIPRFCYHERLLIAGE